MHTDEQAGHGILLEAKFGNEEVVDDVERLERDVEFAIYRQHQRTGDDVVLCRGVVGINAERVASRGIFQVGAGAAVFPVRPGIAEVPLELHSRDLDLLRSWRWPWETRLRPDVFAHQVQTDEQDRSQHRPDGFEANVAMAVIGVSLAAIAVLPRKQPERNLCRHEHNTHGDVSGVELRINLRGVGRGHRWKPHPRRWSNEQVSTNEGD